ncbi:MAG TPA: hypothetical protein VGL19_00145, partial [Polyangiaceae bacterium]
LRLAAQSVAKPSVGLGRRCQGLEEGVAISFGEDERPVALERLLSGMVESAKAVVRQVAPFEPSGPFNESLGPCVDPETEPGTTSATVFFRVGTGGSHG